MKKKYQNDESYITSVMEKAILRPDTVFLEHRDHAHWIPHAFLRRFDYSPVVPGEFYGFKTFLLDH